jgi:CBS domain-containing protein
VKVREIMTADVRSIAPEANLVVAAGIMRDLNVGVLPVCDHDQVTGVVTDRDLVIRALADARDPAQTAVRSIMATEVVYAFDDQDVEDAARLMEVKQVRRLPVLDHDKHLVGIISLGDVATGAGIQLSGEALQEISQPVSEGPND